MPGGVGCSTGCTKARFQEEDIAYLLDQKGAGGHRLFADDFLDWLRKNGTFDGITCGRFPKAVSFIGGPPITVITGPWRWRKFTKPPAEHPIRF